MTNADYDTEFWERARRARDRLAATWLKNPAVQLIDIGYDPQEPPGHGPVVLRVHLRSGTRPERLGLPREIDGIPVRFIQADYRLT